MWRSLRIILIRGSESIQENISYGSGSGAKFHTDPDPRCEKIRYGSGANFHTDPDPGKKRIKYQQNIKNGI